MVLVTSQGNPNRPGASRARVKDITGKVRTGEGGTPKKAIENLHRNVIHNAPSSPVTLYSEANTEDFLMSSLMKKDY